MPEPSADETLAQSGREAIELDGNPHAEKPEEPARIHRHNDPAFKRQQDEKNDQGEDDGSKHDDEKKSKPKDREEMPKPPFYKRPVFWIAIVILAVGLVIGIVYYLHARHYESTDDAFIEGHVIQISPQVSARVQAVYIDDNVHVKKGDPLFDLDPTDYQVALDQAKGNEDAAQGTLEQSKAQVASSKAALDEAKANLDAANITYYNADRDLKRFEALDERARSQQQYDNALTQEKNAAAQVAQAKARVNSAQSQIAVADANVAASQGQYETAVANRKRAEVNLGYCYIKAPGDGRVTTKNIEPGMYATTASPMLAIVQDDVWVVANYKETQLTDMKIGQPVTVKIDAYPDLEFKAHVDSIQMGTGARFSVLPAENATGNYVKVVQRVPVKLRFDSTVNNDQNQLLSPGLSVEPYVLVR